MKFLADTDWIVDYLTGQSEAVRFFNQLSPADIALSIVSYTEIYEGIYTSPDPKAAEAAFRSFLRSLTLLPFSRTVAKRHAQLRRDLRQAKRPLAHRALDLLIAATALTYDLTLLTRNRKDYDDISALKLHPR